MTIERFFVSEAPQAVAPYAHACLAGDFLFVTGQMPIDPATNEYVRGEITQQSIRVLENLKIVLSSSGFTFDDLVSVRVFLTDMRDFDAFNQVYEDYVKNALPARTCVAVSGLAGGADVEIDMVAYRSGNREVFS